jgi:hypothetical protein
MGIPWLQVNAKALSIVAMLRLEVNRLSVNSWSPGAISQEFRVSSLGLVVRVELTGEWAHGVTSYSTQR